MKEELAKEYAQWRKDTETLKEECMQWHKKTEELMEKYAQLHKNTEELKKKKDPEKLKEYKQRHSEWRDIAVNQFSTVNNILITISIGLFALCFKENKLYIYDNYIIPIYIANILLGFSILFGIMVLFSRLYDARISRHIALSRQRIYKKRGILIKEKDFDDSKFCKMLRNLKHILFRKITFIKIENIDDVNLQDNKLINDYFHPLQEQTHILGQTSWIFTKIQVFLFICSGIVYFIYWLIK
jgi:hypothetical protein